MPQGNTPVSPPAGEVLMTHLKKVFNTFINPFSYDPSQYYSVSSFTAPQEVLKNMPLSSQQKAMDVLGRAGGLAIGWAALALAIQQATRRARNVKKRENAAAQLSTHRPVLNIGPNVTARDVAQDEAAGMMEDKVAIDQSIVSNAARLDQVEEIGLPVSVNIPNFLNPLNITKLFREESQGGDRAASPMLAATLLTPLAALYAGWRLSESMSDTSEAAQAKRKQLVTKAKLDRMLAAELARTRGKEADEKKMPVQVPTSWAALKTTLSGAPAAGSEPLSIATDPKGAYNTYVNGLFWVWALSSLAGSYAISRGAFDRLDPARARMKELQRLSRRRALVEGAPTFTLAGSEGSSVGEQELPGASMTRLPVSVETKALPPYQRNAYDPFEPLSAREEAPITLE